MIGAVVGEQLRCAGGDPVAARVLHGMSEILGPTGAAMLIDEPDGPYPLTAYRGRWTRR